MAAVTPFRCRQQLAVWTQGQLEGALLVLIFGLGREREADPALFSCGEGRLLKAKT